MSYYDQALAILERQERSPKGERAKTQEPLRGNEVNEVSPPCTGELAPTPGTALSDPADPDAVNIPRGWRDLVAALPHDQWKRWRDRSTELLAPIAHPTPDDFYRLEHRAACEVLSDLYPEPKAIGFAGTLDEQLTLSVLAMSTGGMTTDRVMQLAKEMMDVARDDVWSVLRTSHHVQRETRDGVDYWRVSPTLLIPTS
jgi:hypothetical protein